jgi:hypothetical protein
MSPHDLGDEIAELAVTDIDLAVCEGGRQPTYQGTPACTKSPMFC